MSPRASVVVVTYGKRHLTERCLESLELALGPKLGSEWEVVVVDNASPDDTADLLREWSDRIEVVLLDRNLNYAGGNNVGARHARGEVLVFLNNDTEVQPGALEALVEEARDETVGGVGIRLLYPDGTIQHGGVVWRRDPDRVLHAFHLHIHEPGDLPAAGVAYDLDVVTAACFAMRRELFLELGGFDEAYVNGYEDVDLCLKTRMAGYRIVYRGDVWLTHNESATRGRGWNMAQNDAVLRSRWEHLLDEDAEVLERLFDARIDHGRLAWYPGPSPFGASVSVEGNVSGLAPEAAEARALLALLERAELAPATRDWHETFVGPRLADPEYHGLALARRRSVAPAATRVCVGAAPVGAATVARLAALPAELPAAAAVWAATPQLAEELAAAGADRDRVAVLPPALPELSAGPGGGGLLVVLPAHDLDAAAAALAEACSYAGRVRVVPSVACAAVAGIVGELAPRAELLPPIASEMLFASVASTVDVVLCADGSDPFERRALLAAGVGAVPVVRAGGTAAALLRDEAATTLEGAQRLAARRAERAALVASICGPAALAPRVRELVAAAQELAARPLLARAA